MSFGFILTAARWLGFTRAGKATLMVLGVLALAMIIWLDGRDRGADAVRDDIREENEEAVNAADAAELGFFECRRTDGVRWDFGAAECVRTE